VNPGLGMKPDPMSMFSTFPTLQIIRLLRQVDQFPPRPVASQLQQVDRRNMKLASSTVFGQLR
jgi:hypothetical protein